MSVDEKIWVKSYDSWVHSEIFIPDVTYLELLERIFVEFSTKTALQFLGKSLSFHDLDSFSLCFAAFLSEKGYAAGDVVAIHLPNTPQYLIANTGAVRSGCLPTGLSPLLSPKETTYQLNDCKARVLVTLDSTLEEKFLKIQNDIPSLKHIVVCNMDDFVAGGRSTSQIPDACAGKIYWKFMDILLDFKPKKLRIRPKPADVFLLQYTGGTTGPPKGTMLTHRNLVADILQCNQWLKIQEGSEIYLPAFPFSHMAGLALGMTAMCMGHTQILIPNPRDTQHICAEIDRQRPTVMAFVPSLYQMLLQEPRFRNLDFSSCRICLSGAAPFAPELMKAVESVAGKQKIVEVYGLTETLILTMNPFHGRKKIGTVGTPLQSTLVKIVDLESGEREIPAGEEGELIARGPQIMQGYYNKPGETARIFRQFQGQTWLFTGDVARMDEDGYLTIVDRVKDMINAAGYKVFSREVEENLYDHPAVAFCAVVGTPNPEQPGSELVKAIIQLTTDYKETAQDVLAAELTAHCRENMAPYKVPKVVKFVENMPLTAVGKVDKKVLE